MKKKYIFIILLIVIFFTGCNKNINTKTTLETIDQSISTIEESLIPSTIETNIESTIIDIPTTSKLYQEFNFDLPKEIKIVRYNEEGKVKEMFIINNIDKLNKIFSNINNTNYEKGSYTNEKVVLNLLFDNEIIQIINETTFVYNYVIYKVINGDFTFLDEYNLENADCLIDDDGWLPWV